MRPLGWAPTEPGTRRTAPKVAEATNRPLSDVIVARNCGNWIHRGPDPETSGPQKPPNHRRPRRPPPIHPLRQNRTRAHLAASMARTQVHLAAGQLALLSGTTRATDAPRSALTHRAAHGMLASYSRTAKLSPLDIAASRWSGRSVIASEYADSARGNLARRPNSLVADEPSRSSPQLRPCYHVHRTPPLASHFRIPHSDPPNGRTGQ